MAFINEIYLCKKIFRDIEKATKKCVHLNGAIEYIHIYQYSDLQQNHLLTEQSIFMRYPNDIFMRYPNDILMND